MGQGKKGGEAAGKHRNTGRHPTKSDKRHPRPKDNEFTQDMPYSLLFISILLLQCNGGAHKLMTTEGRHVTAKQNPISSLNSYRDWRGIGYCMKVATEADSAIDVSFPKSAPSACGNAK